MSIRDYDTCVIECTNEDNEIYSGTRKGDILIRGTVDSQKVNVSNSLVVSPGEVNVNVPVMHQDQGAVVNAPYTVGTLYGSRALDQGEYDLSSDSFTPEDALNTLSRIDVQKYSNGQVGCPGAQLAQVYPKCVYKDAQDRRMVDYSKLVPHLMLAVQMGNVSGSIASVIDSGARGDGVQDDTLAFDKALETASAIYIPEGTYMLGGTRPESKDAGGLWLKGDKTVIMTAGTKLIRNPEFKGGDGISSHLVLCEGKNNHIIGNGATVDEKKVFVTNVSTNNSSCVCFKNCSHCSVQDLSAIDPDRRVDANFRVIQDSEHVSIRHCYARRSTYGQLFELKDCKSCTITGCMGEGVQQNSKYKYGDVQDCFKIGDTCMFNSVMNCTAVKGRLGFHETGTDTHANVWSGCKASGCIGAGFAALASGSMGSTFSDCISIENNGLGFCVRQEGIKINNYIGWNNSLKQSSYLYENIGAFENAFDAKNNVTTPVEGCDMVVKGDRCSLNNVSVSRNMSSPPYIAGVYVSNRGCVISGMWSSIEDLPLVIQAQDTVVTGYHHDKILGVEGADAGVPEALIAAGMDSRIGSHLEVSGDLKIGGEIRGNVNTLIGAGNGVFSTDTKTFTSFDNTSGGAPLKDIVTSGGRVSGKIAVHPTSRTGEFFVYLPSEYYNTDGVIEDETRNSVSLTVSTPSLKKYAQVTSFEDGTHWRVKATNISSGSASWPGVLSLIVTRSWS